MKREDELKRLAMNLAEWPKKVGPYQAAPGQGFWVSFPAGVVVRFASEGVDAISQDDWFAERQRLINKPSWEDAPEWATHLSQQPTGEWYFWPQKPSIKRTLDDLGERFTHNHYAVGRPVTFFCTGAIPAGHDWRTTLERRPEQIDADKERETDANLRRAHADAVVARARVGMKAATRQSPTDRMNAQRNNQALDQAILEISKTAARLIPDPVLKWTEFEAPSPYSLDNSDLQSAIGETVQYLRPTASRPVLDSDTSAMLRDHLETLLIEQSRRALEVSND